MHKEERRKPSPTERAKKINMSNENTKEREIAFAIAEAVTIPSNDLENRIELLLDFSETYLETEKARADLLFDILHRCERVNAKIYALLTLLRSTKESLDLLQVI